MGTKSTNFRHFPLRDNKKKRFPAGTSVYAVGDGGSATDAAEGFSGVFVAEAKDGLVATGGDVVE